MDILVNEIGMNRTNFIQQSIIRNVKYMHRYEFLLSKIDNTIMTISFHRMVRFEGNKKTDKLKP